MDRTSPGTPCWRSGSRRHPRGPSGQGVPRGDRHRRRAPAARVIDLHRLNTRIGLHYGEISSGNIGGDHHQHSVMGDIVNTASRIEGMNKHLGTRVLVSSEAIDQLGRWLMRELGSFRLKRKNLADRDHELICRLEEADGKTVRGVPGIRRGPCRLQAEILGGSEGKIPMGRGKRWKRTSLRAIT